MTIRQLIDEKLSKIKQANNLQEEDAGKILVELSALLSNINQEIKDRADAFNQKLLEIIERPKMSVAKAQIIAKTMPEWHDLEIAKGYKEATLETIRSLKYYLRAQKHEWEVARNL